MLPWPTEKLVLIKIIQSKFSAESDEQPEELGDSLCRENSYACMLVDNVFMKFVGRNILDGSPCTAPL